MNRYKKKTVLAAAAALIAIVLWIRNRFGAGCYITQYADVTGSQAMFYTIETEDGGLIVVDGGNAGNEDYVRSVIEEKGGHVDAWFLTHPHPDHIGVFNMLWDELQSDIDVVYSPEIDYMTYQERAFAWDGFGYYETFLDKMSDSGRLAWLHTGDELELGGLRFRILHACDAFVYERSRDIANDGGLMIKVINEREAMLFCSDVGISMADKIIQQYADEIKCDYIQMGHHGNGGLSEGFYRLSAPKAAFFDAPEWLMDPPEGSGYTTPENRRLMESLGAEIYDYSTAPNRIRLR